MKPFRFTMLFAIALSLASATGFCQVPAATSKDTPDQRLAYMQSTGATYTVSIDSQRLVTFGRDPVLRFTNPVSGVVDGGLFVWQVDGGRPVVVAQFFIAPGSDDLWIHEFQSLTSAGEGTSRGAMKFVYDGRVVWSPSTAGIEFKNVSGAASPAKSAAARLTQMRQIVRRFSVTDDFEGADADELRMMSTPLVRYADKATIDGALFVYSHGTDPELLVIVEAVPPKDSDVEGTKSASTRTDDSAAGAGWRVALAPMTSYAITAELDGVEYWSVPWRMSPHPVTATFKNFAFPPDAPVEQPKSLLQRIIGQ